MPEGNVASHDQKLAQTIDELKRCHHFVAFVELADEDHPGMLRVAKHVSIQPDQQSVGLMRHIAEDAQRIADQLGQWLDEHDA